MAVPSLEGLIEANAAFYKAFEGLDIHAFRQLNMASKGDVCVHPGWRPLSGWADIEHSWVGIFEHTTYMQIVPSEVNAQLHGEVGWISCFENIYSFVGVERMLGQVVATNIFKWTEDGWKLVLHHGSPVLQPEEDAP